MALIGKFILERLLLERQEQSATLATQLPKLTRTQSRAVSAPGIRSRKLRRDEN